MLACTREPRNNILRPNSSSAWIWCVALIGLALVSSARAQTVTYIHTDALGSVVAESDANGNVIKRYDYEPYGAVVGGEVTDGPGYTGHVSDQATGLSYMQQRYMDPQLGMFLSVDPVVAYDQPVNQFNRYRYANSNPYKFTDPDGGESGSVYSSMYKAELRHGMSTSGTALTEQQVGTIVDFMPIIGDAKGFVDAYNSPSMVNVVSAAVGLAGPIGDAAGKIVQGAAKISDAAGLNKQLTSAKQLGDVMSGNGSVIAGGASGKELRDAPRLSAVHGGEASDWTKVTSTTDRASDGHKISIHAYQNQATGQVVEPKTKLIEKGK